MSAAIIEQIQQASAKNAELLQTLTSTDYAVPSLQDHLLFIRDLQNELKQVGTKLAKLERKRKDELKDHVKYRDSHLRRFAYKATGQREKFDAKAEKEAREYFAVLQQEHETTVLQDGLKAQLDEAGRVRAELESAAEVHKSAQRELDSLYNSIFGGETPHFPEEDVLERNSEAALQRYHDARTKFEEETRVVGLLTLCRQRVQTALQFMDQAISASQMDIVGFGGGAADFMERHNLARAEASIAEARALAAQARVTDLPRVNINQGHLLSDMIFDNIFTDMRFHEEIKRGRLEVQRFAQAVAQRSVAVRERLETAQVQMKSGEGELERTRNELQMERRRLFERYAEAQANGPPQY